MTGFPNAQDNPAAAIPVYLTSGTALTITNYSDSFDTGNTTVIAENTSRRYLFIQCVTPGEDIWVNVLGDDAVPETPGSFLLTAGQTYESGPVVPPGAVAVYVGADNVGITILEG